MALNPIPSTIPTSSFYQLALQALYDIAGEGGGASGGVTISSNGASVSSANPLPVVQGFVIPAYDDVVLQYNNVDFPTKPTYITFKKNGTNVFALDLSYDANGAVTRILQD